MCCPYKLTNFVSVLEQSHVTTALQEEINSERQKAASFDEAVIIDIVPYSSISERDGLRVVMQKKVSGDTVMLSLSIPKSFDYPQEILKRMLAQALKNIYEMGNLDEFKNHTVPHSQHSSNRFIDIPHRSNEGYEHELTSNISPCEKVSVTNALATISGEQKDLINVAIYSFSALDGLKPEIQNKLIGGKKKIPNQNSPNIQFTLSELFDHPEENCKKKKCASECRSQIIGNVYESGNDNVGRKESCQSLRQVEFLHDIWRHLLSPSPQFRYGTGGEGNILQPSALVVPAATAHKTFGSTDIMSMYSVCTRRVFGGFDPRPSGLESNTLNN
ncbi:uncharacterized protein TNCV_1072771 [Trichonephila clavipes]|nr:uncharacterized protein TNCV_1072771 [Trichonephila clavipes]